MKKVRCFHSHLRLLYNEGNRIFEDIRPLSNGLQALEYAYSRSSSASLTHLHRIFTSTYGILFFGTPHLGSAHASTLASLTKMLSLSLPRKALSPSSTLISTLREDSETLQLINDAFAPLMSRFRIFFLWEQLPTDLKYTWSRIVEESSAAPMMIGGVERAGIEADHRDMVRFTKAEEAGFRTVVAAIRRYTEDAPRLIAERYRLAGEAAERARMAEAKELLA